MKSFRHYIEEIYIAPNNRAKYGQIIFLVGGAGSGKTTATKKFIDTTNYKILNPDDVKELIIRAGKRGVEAFGDVADIDPNSPTGSQDIHKAFVNKRVGSRREKSRMKGLRGSNNLPNLIYDRSFSFAGEFKRISQDLISVGYKSENIHVVFVMTDVDMALKRNRTRERSLPDSVIKQTNSGARERFMELFFQRAEGAVANGDYYIIVNRGESAIQVKEAGKRIDLDSDIAKKVAAMLGKRSITAA